MVIGIEKEARAHVENVCKIGQGALCCKYLVIGMKGYECMRVSPENKKVIDDNWKTTAHVAQGDNCAGYDKIKKNA